MKLRTEIEYSGGTWKYRLRLFVNDTLVKSNWCDALWYGKLWSWWQLHFYRPINEKQVKTIHSKEREL